MIPDGQLCAGASIFLSFYTPQCPYPSQSAARHERGGRTRREGRTARPLRDVVPSTPASWSDLHDADFVSPSRQVRGTVRGNTRAPATRTGQRMPSIKPRPATSGEVPLTGQSTQTYMRQCSCLGNLDVSPRAGRKMTCRHQTPSSHVGSICEVGASILH